MRDEMSQLYERLRLLEEQVHDLRAVIEDMRPDPDAVARAIKEALLYRARPPVAR